MHPSEIQRTMTTQRQPARGQHTLSIILKCDIHKIKLKSYLTYEMCRFQNYVKLKSQANIYKF
jgi:hypothetical protein